MKKVLIFIFIALITVVASDLTFGVISRYYVNNYRIPGDYETIDYLIKSSTDDVVILGSSVALNSAVSSIIEDSLNLTTWNGACNGQNLPYYETILDCLLKRHKPKMVILGFRENELNCQSKSDRFNMLAPYYRMGFDVLDSYMEEGDKADKIMMNSNLYRYNTIWVRILLYNFIQPGEKGEKGFIAKGIPMYYPTMVYENNDENVSEYAVESFNRILKTCNDNNIEVSIFFPPVYKTYPNNRCSSVDRIKEICKDRGIGVYDAFQDSSYLQNPKLFYDNIHLNGLGAKSFTKELAHWLKEMLNCNVENYEKEM